MGFCQLPISSCICPKEGNFYKLHYSCGSAVAMACNQALSFAHTHTPISFLGSWNREEKEVIAINEFHSKHFGLFLIASFGLHASSCFIFYVVWLMDDMALCLHSSSWYPAFSDTLHTLGFLKVKVNPLILRYFFL